MHVPSRAMAAVGLAASALVVVVVVAVGLGVHGRSRTGSPVSGRGVRIVFRARTLDPGSPLGPALERSTAILRQRLRVFFPGARVSQAGAGLVVLAPHATSADRPRIVALAVPARLELYDWEANALTSDGRTVASQLQTRDAAAIAVSQGRASVAPGQPGAGTLPLYAAVKLAFRQPPSVSRTNPRPGDTYFLFGAPGSAACAAAARDRHTAAAPRVHCLLSGPDVESPTATQRRIQQDLAAGLPQGVSAVQGQERVVRPGTVVLQAAPASAAQQTGFNSPAAQFYVLRDNVSLRGSDITNPTQGTDQGGNPDVQFGFSSVGQSAFQSVTATIAHRGDTVSSLGHTYNQHFAVALDNQLVTVPQIDYHQNPDGIIGGSGGVDITGGFTITSARDLAAMLRFGPLPVTLAAR